MSTSFVFRFTSRSGHTHIINLSTNPWHVALVKAEKTGTVLADILSRCSQQKFYLFGHSLGGRVVHSALTALGTQKTQRVPTACILGGAVSHEDAKYWEHALKAASGNVLNFYSSNDSVLKYMYSVGTFFQSSACGRNSVEGARNIDVSTMVSGHCGYWNTVFREKLEQAFDP